MFLAACIQLRCTMDIERNLEMTEALVRRAAKAGAKLIATPENTSLLGPQFHKVDLAQPVDGEIGQRLSRLAQETETFLLIGSLNEERRLSDGQIDAQRCYNTSLLFGPDGTLMERYRKIHLFDVDVPGGLSVRESDTICPGDTVTVANTPLGKLGMSICYDLRFPELYRMHVDQGADMIAIPSAFTLTTGKDHWHALLRARAIETQCWVLAPAQWGIHDDEGKRQSYGHSVIIDPWGTIVAECGDGEGICYAEINLDYTQEVRTAIPVRNHRRV
ncbi:MAG: hydrolase [Myxococcales bacterium]|nr:hydrolase [Myxococcales bacterium]